ncbi:MAG: quorum-sensing autoinducer CAI-1 synthase [Burkholderiales bacterium]|jgi:CAI-1 autoinducer synthase|nr:quorum-sensing autoinducer CAI-1 synthase [Burkholderiales bacterium]
MFDSTELQEICPSSANLRSEPRLTDRVQSRIDGFMAYYREHWGGRLILHGRPAGSDAIRLDGNDYLGLTGHPEIAKAIITATRHDTEFSIQSGAFLLEDHPSRLLEKSFARWIGKEDGLLCQSGYAANVGLLQAIADEGTPVYIDNLAHMSIWEGARAAHTKPQGFRHNDPDHLNRLMAHDGPGVVVVDSVYSTIGTRCRLPEIVDVAECHRSMIVVDESHSLGTHGPRGSGLCAEHGLTHRVHFITTSLAKAFAGRAGFFTVPVGLRDYVLMQSFPNIFSSCLLPHEVAGLAATLGVVRQATERRHLLWRNVRRLRTAFAGLGYPLQGTEQILALEAGPESESIILRDALEAHGVFGAIFCAPATSRNRSMVRLTVSAALTDSEIDRVIEVAREIAPQVKPWTWPAARRAAVRSAAAA